MCGTSESRTELPLASAAQSGCGCCSPASDTRAASSTAARPQVQASVAQYALEGLTCAHCVRTVEKALSGVAGVRSATVELVPGGTSRLNVTGTADQEALAEAIRSSGYALAGAK